jgi:hypothetical protein
VQVTRGLFVAVEIEKALIRRGGLYGAPPGRVSV